MRPSEIRKSRFPNLIVWERQVEFPEGTQIASRKAFAVDVCQLCSQFVDQLCAVLGSLVTLLFLFDDALPDFPLALDHEPADLGIRLSTSTFDNGTDVIKEMVLC